MSRVVKCDRPGCNRTIDSQKEPEAPFLHVIIRAQDGRDNCWGGGEGGHEGTAVDLCSPECVVKMFATYQNKDWKMAGHSKDIFSELPREGILVKP